MALAAQAAHLIVIIEFPRPTDQKPRSVAIKGSNAPQSRLILAVRYLWLSFAGSQTAGDWDQRCIDALGWAATMPP